MKGDRWKEIDAALERALDLPPDARERFIDGLDEPPVRRALRELLRAADASEAFLGTPIHELCSPPWEEVFAHADDVPAAEELDRSDERVGPYRLVRRLGRGGMATVYLAERADGLWQQEVALKLIRRGLESDDVVRRFLAERQILSSLRHPNIAALLDGGTTEGGLPYLVMEYVEGTPITRYCDEGRLSVDDRLRLVCEVGRAVQHAHGSLVVHRDLKPSNILVTAEGRVKLLDFGIAKLLDPSPAPDSTALTRPGHRPLTPEYASPEQLEGGPVTTATDVYQLGVLLYRLLCGRRPVVVGDRASRIPLARSARPDSTGSAEVLPLAPSRAIVTDPAPEGDDVAGTGIASARGTTVEGLARRLAGDLDTVVGTCLRRAPDERYASMGALVEDLERHLEQLPIRARAPTRRYRFRKFLKRNVWVAPVAAAALLVVVGYGLTMHLQARALERERNMATAEAARAEAIQSFVTGLFQTADPFAPGETDRGRLITVAEALDVGSERARSELADRPELQADVLGAIAGVYEGLDLDAPAAELRREALELARAVHGPGSPEVGERLHDLGNAVAEPDSAARLLRASLGIMEEHFGSDGPEYAAVLVSLGRLDVRRSAWEAAVRHLEQGVALLEEAPSSPESALAAARSALAQAYPHVNRPEEAVEAGRWSVSYYGRALGDGHPRTALARVHLADGYDGLGEPERAIELYRDALPVLDRSLGPDHTETISARNNLAVSLFRTDRLVEAEDVLGRSLEIRVEKYGEVHEQVADGLQNLAATLNGLGRLDEAEATLERARTIYVEVLGPDDYRATLPLLTLTQIRLDRRNFVGAEGVAREAVGTLRRVLPEGHFVTAVAECRWGLALAGLGRTTRATPLVEGAANALLETQQGGRNRRGCLEAAVEHLRGIGAAPDRWAPIQDALEVSSGS